MKNILHKWNKFPSNSVTYATNTPETYSNMKNIPLGVYYKKYQWEVSRDFKVIVILLELQLRGALQ